MKSYTPKMAHIIAVASSGVYKDFDTNDNDVRDFTNEAMSVANGKNSDMIDEMFRKLPTETRQMILEKAIDESGNDPGYPDDYRIVTDRLARMLY